MMGEISRLGQQLQARCPPGGRCHCQPPTVAQLQPFRGHIIRQKPAHRSSDARRSDLSRRLDLGGDVGRPLDVHSATGAAALADQPAAAPLNVDSPEGLYDAREALRQSSTRFVAETKLPTKSGNYRVRAYRHTVAGGMTEPMCIMTGNPEGCRDVVVRVHDACFTSEVLGSLKCDCAEQLQLAMRYIQDCPPGIIIYLQQEGRGIGLANKIAAYALQEKGFDTVDANRELGFEDDCREYTSVYNILADLGITSVKLMTNNPRKINTLEALGVKVTERIPCIVQSQEFNEGYLAVKAARMSHVLDGPKLDGSYCYWNHSGEPLPPIETGNGSSPPSLESPTGSSHDTNSAGSDASMMPGASSPPPQQESSQPPSR